MLATLAIIYVFVCLCVCVFQRRLLYVPTKLTRTMAEHAGAQKGLSPWLDASGEFIGWKTAAKADAAGSVLIVHGNAGSAVDRSYIANPIHDALPLDVLVLEYPGFGPRPGDANLRSILDAAERAFDLLPKQKPVYLVSESLGAGPAAHLAKLHPDRVKGLAMFVPYDELARVAQHAMPIFPSRLFLYDRFNPALWLKDYRGPIKFVLAGADEVIPSRFGQSLFESYGGPKQRELIPSAGHNEVESQSLEWWREVYAFWQKAEASGQTHTAK